MASNKVFKLIIKLNKLVVLMVCLLGFSLANTFLHESPKEVLLSKPSDFEIELGSTIFVPSINNVEIFYKGSNDLLFSKANMSSLQDNKYFINLNLLLNDSTELNYYFKVSMQDGKVYTWPEFYPEENAFVIPVKKNFNDPTIRLISPLNKSKVFDALPVMMISYEDKYGILDINTIKLTLDDVDITKQANIYGNMLTFVPQRPLTETEHVLVFTVSSKQEQEYKIVSKFQYLKKVPTLVDITGRESLQIDLFNTDKDSSVNNRKSFRMRNNLQVNIRSALLNADIMDYTTSEEDSGKQKLNRTGLYLYDPNRIVELRLMDSAPVLSEYTLNGVNVDGVNLKVRLIPDILDVTYITGKTNRQIEGLTDPTDNIVGAFEQNINALQVGLDLGDWRTEINYVRFKDNTGGMPTVNWGEGTKPQENVALSLLNKWSFFNKAGYIKSEIAGSIGYEDITSVNRLSVDVPEFLHDIIPLYGGSIPNFGAAANIEMGTPFIFRELYLQTFGSLVFPKYNTFGNTSIKKDDMSYGATAKLNLLRGNASFSGTYKKSRDNVMQIPVIKDIYDSVMSSFLTISGDSNENAHVTEGDEIRFNSNINMFNFCNFGLNYNLNTKLNNATDNAYKVDNETNMLMYSFSNINWSIGEYSGKFNTNISKINYTDAISSANNFEQNSLGFGLDTVINNYKLRFNYTSSKKDNFGTTPNSTVYNTIGVRGDYEYIRNILNLYAGLTFQTGFNDGADISKHIDTSKTSLIVGGIYSIPSNFYIFQDNKLYFSLEMIGASDNKAESNDRTKNFSEQLFTFRYTTVF